jgi:SAM-dependent methyltransferase
MTRPGNHPTTGPTVAPEPSGHTYLDFAAPLSDDRCARLVALLAPAPGARVLDLGCGWAEFLLRVLSAEPTATGTGVDTDDEAVERGLRNARARGLEERVTLTAGDALAVTGPADVVAVGTSHVWGGTAPALQALAALVAPGGRVLFGDAVWDRPPPATALEALGAADGEIGLVADLVDAAEQAGLRVLDLGQASLEEWDDFESRWCAGRERWLLDHPGHPDAGAVRAVVDDHRRRWLRGYRGELGFAYLVLAAPAA